MKRFAAIILALTATSAALAQTHKPVAPVKPPVISYELQAKFFKAQAWLDAAQLALEHAQQAQKEKQDGFTAAIEEVRKACGENFTAGLSAAGDPVCQPKASAPAK